MDEEQKANPWMVLIPASLQKFSEFHWCRAGNSAEGVLGEPPFNAMMDAMKEVITKENGTQVQGSTAGATGGPEALGADRSCAPGHRSSDRTAPVASESAEREGPRRELPGTRPAASQEISFFSPEADCRCCRCTTSILSHDTHVHASSIVVSYNMRCSNAHVWQATMQQL